MFKLVSDRTQARIATIETALVASPASLSQPSEESGGLDGYAISIQSNNRLLTELAMAERRVPEINACVDRQRQLIKQLADAAKDTTSAEIMLDSLIVSLFLAAEDRHRLRVMLKMNKDDGHSE